MVRLLLQQLNQLLRLMVNQLVKELHETTLIAIPLLLFNISNGRKFVSVREFSEKLQCSLKKIALADTFLVQLSRDHYKRYSRPCSFIIHTNSTWLLVFAFSA
jgi:hypothetical protein